MNKILVLGGLDDTHVGLNDFFTNYVYELKIISFNSREEMYVCTPKSAMQTGRGCFGLCSKDNIVYAFGGVTGKDFSNMIGKERIDNHDSTDTEDEGEDGLSSLCEKYDTETD